MISLAYKISHCLSGNHNPELPCLIFTGVTLFALVLHLNCTALSQSEWSNFFSVDYYNGKLTNKHNSLFWKVLFLGVSQNLSPKDQFRYIKIQLSTGLMGITIEFTEFFPKSLVLRLNFNISKLVGNLGYHLKSVNASFRS